MSNGHCVGNWFAPHRQSTRGAGFGNRSGRFATGVSFIIWGAQGEPTQHLEPMSTLIGTSRFPAMFFVPIALCQTLFWCWESGDHPWCRFRLEGNTHPSKERVLLSGVHPEASEYQGSLQAPHPKKANRICVRQLAGVDHWQ